MSTLFNNILEEDSSLLLLQESKDNYLKLLEQVLDNYNIIKDYFKEYSKSNGSKNLTLSPLKTIEDNYKIIKENDNSFHNTINLILSYYEFNKMASSVLITQFMHVDYVKKFEDIIIDFNKDCNKLLKELKHKNNIKNFMSEISIMDLLNIELLNVNEKYYSNEIFNSLANILTLKEYSNILIPLTHYSDSLNTTANMLNFYNDLIKKEKNFNNRGIEELVSSYKDFYHYSRCPINLILKNNLYEKIKEHKDIVEINRILETIEDFSKHLCYYNNKNNSKHHEIEVFIKLFLILNERQLFEVYHTIYYNYSHEKFNKIYYMKEEINRMKTSPSSFMNKLEIEREKELKNYKNSGYDFNDFINNYSSEQPLEWQLELAYKNF